MNENVCNLEVIITKEASSSYYGFKNVMVREWPAACSFRERLLPNLLSSLIYKEESTIAHATFSNKRFHS